MKAMFEDANSGVMVPDSVMLRAVHNAFHYSLADTVEGLFGDDWDGETGPITGAPCLEPIDNDPTINDLLAAQNL